MKAVVVSQAGGPEVLEVKEIAKPQVKTGWCLVNIKGFTYQSFELTLIHRHFRLAVL